MNKITYTREITTLEDIALRKKQLKGEITQCQERMGVLWKGFFRNDTQEEEPSPKEKIMQWVSISTNVVDGVITGWKLYRKFGGFFDKFRKRKSKK